MPRSRVSSSVSDACALRTLSSPHPLSFCSRLSLDHGTLKFTLSQQWKTFSQTCFTQNTSSVKSKKLFYKHSPQFLSQITSKAGPTIKERVPGEYSALRMCLQQTFCLFGLPVIFPETQTSSFLNTDMEVMWWFMHKATEEQLCLCPPAFKIAYNWGLGHNYHYYRVNC